MDIERLRLHIEALCERIVQDIEREHVEGISHDAVARHQLTLARLEALCNAYRVLAENNEGGTS